MKGRPCPRHRSTFPMTSRSWFATTGYPSRGSAGRAREAVNESGSHFRRELAYAVLDDVEWREVVAGTIRMTRATARLWPLCVPWPSTSSLWSPMTPARPSARQRRARQATRLLCAGDWRGLRELGAHVGSYGFYEDGTPEEGFREPTGASDKDDAEWAALGGDVLAEVHGPSRAAWGSPAGCHSGCGPQEAARIVRGRRRGTYMYKSADPPAQGCGVRNWASSATCGSRA